MRITQDQDGETLHRETPDHAEGVQVRKKGDVSSADDDGDDLKARDDIDDAVGSPEASVRLPKPTGQDSVFRNAIQHSVRTHNGGVHRAGEDQRAHHHHEAMERSAAR